MSRGRWIHRSDIQRKGQREDLDEGTILRCGFNALENVIMTTAARAATGAGWAGFFCAIRIPVHSRCTHGAPSPLLRPGHMTGLVENRLCHHTA